MGEVLSGGAWWQALTEFHASAWRWECQGVYNEPSEREPFRQYLLGQQPDTAFMDDWYAAVRRNVAAGKTYGRIRVLTEPLTDYLRFELSFTHLNVQAGEEVRVMHQSRARELGLPEQDFWLWDDERVAAMHFDENGFDYAEVVTDPAQVREFREIRARAWEDAVPFSDMT
ncbi:DUF6879 family protein [Actinocrispum wychmicini]|uniref:DUF6879 domain-containing protein n=1 Tax=Actinocrispum wychmicini TaxID=1213861 RepID=A0A4R2K5A8_9PSEU|nr:DUF6879 family protein [Actinocrispum wychmicini]TCO64968.1 hypothetical protein EV192_101752 [Actinocrispum wychmicini]